MKKINRLLAFCVAVIMAFTAISVSVFATSNTLKGKTIVAFGDSLTALGTPSYTKYLSDLLGVDVINSGVGGDTTYKGYVRFQKDVLDKNPDVVLLCFGMNDQAMDLVYNSNFMPLQSYISYLEYFTETLQAMGTDVIFITPHPVLDASGYYNSAASIAEGYNYSHPGQMDIYCNAMRNVASKYNCSLIDINYEFNLLKTNNYNTFKSYYATNDGVHQNQTGRQAWAKFISEFLHAKYDGVNKSIINVKCVDENGKTIKTVEYVGAKNANITIVPPVLGAYTTTSAAVKKTFSGTQTVTINYVSQLAPLVEKAETVDFGEYSERMLSVIRKEYQNAKALISADELDFDSILKCYNSLKNALDSKGAYDVILSNGKSYETTEPNYRQWDSSTGGNTGPLVETYVDDGIRLTNGKASGTKHESAEYSVWMSDADIIVDMGEKISANSFNGFFASYTPHGIQAPQNIKIYVSDNKSSWTEVDATVQKTQLTNESSNSWNRHKLSAKAKSVVSGRYFKFAISRHGSFIWIDEVQVGISCPVISKGIDLGEGIEIYSTTSSSLAEKNNLVAKWDDSAKAYVINDVNSNKAALAEDEIIIVYENNSQLSNAKIGQYISICGFEEGVAAYMLVAESASELNSLIPKVERNLAFEKSYTISGSGVGYEYDDPTWGYARYQANLTDGIALDSQDFNNDWFGIYQGPLVTPNVVNGVCTITIDLGADYDLSKVSAHFRNYVPSSMSAPTSVKVSVAEDGGSYSPVGTFGNINTSDNAIYWSWAEIDAVGRYVKLEIGTSSTFVFLNEIQVFGADFAKPVDAPPAANEDGGNGDEDNSDDTNSDDTNSDDTNSDDTNSDDTNSDDTNSDDTNSDDTNSDDTNSDDTNSDDTNSDDTNSDDTNSDDTNSDDTNSDDECALGDINNNDKIDMTDYILLKRAYFGTYKFTDAQNKAGDINKNGKIDMTDYILLKRVYFGTYKIG